MIEPTTTKSHRLLALSAAVCLSAFAASPAQAASFMIDLTHPLGTFNPTEGDITKPDLTRPHGDSIAVPTFGNQVTYEILPNFPTNQGHFQIGRMLVYEHHGTHMDSTAHFINNAESTEPGAVAKRQFMHELTVEDLIGKAVVIDISARVQAELDKNSGKPSPDTKITDFSNRSANVIMPEDVDAIADQLEEGDWIVAATGWSQFFYDADWSTTPYLNGFNFPGFNADAIDRLIEIENEKSIRINGIVADNIGVDSGQNSKGDDDKFSNSFRSHVRGQQRGWKIVENATNLTQLSMAKKGGCTIIVGAPKHVGGAGGPSRVFAMCEK